MLGIYNYTVILTYMGLLAGFSGIWPHPMDRSVTR